jgi:ribosomal protein L32
MKAQTAYAVGRYTEAFSLALKGRRGLGGNVGAVGPTPGVKPSSLEPEAPDLDRAVESAAGATRCPQCGHPTTADDAFCRGCGTSRAPTACPQCGAPRLPADTFCGRCGARFS